MKVCFVCDEYPPGAHGGIGTCTQLLARALAAAGHEVRVVGVVPPGYGTPQGASPPYEEDAGVRVWRLPYPEGRFGWVAARARLFRHVAAWARRGAIDVVEVPDWGGWAAGWPDLPVPLVARLNGSATFFAAELGRPVHRITRLLERRSVRRATYWCASSRYLADRSRPLLGLAGDADAILYNPIEMPRESPTTARPASDDVVFTGTLVPKKGIISLVRAWPAVVAARPTATLHVFGKDGRTDEGQPMQAWLQAQLPAEARARVHFHGHVGRERLYSALRDARAAVFPSYAEAFGIAPFEAMACGCPTIYTRRPPGPELVRDGVDGLLVDPDATAEIAAAVLRLLRDPALAERLGAAGRERVATCFATEVMLPRNEAFLRACVDRDVGRGVARAPIAPRSMRTPRRPTAAEPETGR